MPLAVATVIILALALIDPRAPLARYGRLSIDGVLLAEIAVRGIMLIALLVAAAAWLDWLIRELRWRGALAMWAREQTEETLARVQSHDRVRSARLMIRNELRRRGKATGP